MKSSITCLECKANNPLSSKYCGQCGTILPDPRLGNFHQLYCEGRILNGNELRGIYRNIFSYDFQKGRDQSAAEVLKRHSAADLKKKFKPAVARFFSSEAVLEREAIKPCLDAYREFRDSYRKEGEYKGASAEYLSGKAERGLLPGLRELKFLADKASLDGASSHLSDMSYVLQDTTQKLWSSMPRGARRFFDSSSVKGFDLRYDREMVLLILDTVVEHLEGMERASRSGRSV